ncbi:phosphoglycerate dehydrogenase [Magnetospira sp. QH-2]|uniref:phosphoglycerate dehydrogenase n=1 Tax=Magnetospira sp. (strain QH-2) TaxID=1288970 RepID=UPI0003E80FF9|nr:phosphoglycerate dehydrogenase [Magnetospira sp. QH-2]CCQ73288.1 D-3-phosphoglycerate dehydrogenase [Magnetospira sp. QH-2]
MVKVLISDKMAPEAAEIFQSRGIEVDVITGMTPDELKACIGQYDGLAIRSATKATAEIIEAAENMKVIGRAGIGTDNIDKPAATAKGIVVMNTPFGNSITTAEHAIAMMMASARMLPQANSSTHGGLWEKSKFMGVELMGKTLGVIGTGNIGSAVCERAIGLKMKVVAYDPFLSEERATEIGVEKVDLDELFARADFITLHTPLTDATRAIIDTKAMLKMKKGVRIINCARGGLVVEADLKQAIESGHVAGAALDVYENEPAKENALFGMDQVVCTPHLGASTTEAQEKVALQVAEQMADYLLTGAVTNALNMPSVSAEDAPKLKPYMQLADQMGSFAGQIIESALLKVNIEYSGAAIDLNTKPLTAIILRGILAPLMDDSVNMVNAPVLAKERDIAVSETRNEGACEYHTLIRLEVTTEKRTRSVSGTLFAGSPRIIEMEGVPVDAELSAHMLYIHNEDKPGFIGSLGTLLGNEGLNIGTFHLGRDDAGALALVAVDQEVGEDLVEKVVALPHVTKGKALKF